MVSKTFFRVRRIRWRRRRCSCCSSCKRRRVRPPRQPQAPERTLSRVFNISCCCSSTLASVQLPPHTPPHLPFQVHRRLTLPISRVQRLSRPSVTPLVSMVSVHHFHFIFASSITISNAISPLSLLPFPLHVTRARKHHPYAVFVLIIIRSNILYIYITWESCQSLPRL